MHKILFESECLVRYSLSIFFKRIHERKIPFFILNLVIKIFQFLYRVDGSEFEQRKFESFSDYFTRGFTDLNTQRPLGNGLVSPVDAMKFRIQNFDKNSVIQVKATKTTLEDFTGHKLNHADFFAIHFYLSPKNYHRIHCPLNNVEIIDASYMEGHRLMIEKLDASFLTQNERACLHLKAQTEVEFYLIMTGAFCVGNIFFTNQKIILNKKNIRNVIGEKFNYLDEIGRFAFGSSVSLILEKSIFLPNENLKLKETINLGESLCELKINK